LQADPRGWAGKWVKGNPRSKSIDVPASWSGQVFAAAAAAAAAEWQERRAASGFEGKIELKAQSESIGRQAVRARCGNM